MGATASVLPPEYDLLTAEAKEDYKLQYDSLKNEGKSDDEVIEYLKQKAAEFTPEMTPTDSGDAVVNDTSVTVDAVDPPMETETIQPSTEETQITSGDEEVIVETTTTTDVVISSTTEDINTETVTTESVPVETIVTDQE